MPSQTPPILLNNFGSDGQTMNRKLTWILLASLLFNAALVGFLVGNHGRGGPMDVFRRAPPPGMMNLRPDDSTRSILKSAFDAERANLDKAMKDIVEARRESEAVLRADPLDLDKLDAAMARLRTSSGALQESFHRALRDAATKLTGPQRSTLGRMLERAPTGRIRSGGPISNAVVDIVNRSPPGPPPGPSPHVAPLPPGMGLGAPAPPPPPGE